MPTPRRLLVRTPAAIASIRSIDPMPKRIHLAVTAVLAVGATSGA